MGNYIVFRITVILVFIYGVVSQNACAQAGKALHLTVKLDTEDGNWDSIKVIIQDDSGKARYEHGDMLTKLVFPYQQKFFITFIKPGTKAKHIDVETYVPANDAKKKAAYSIRTQLYKRGQGEITPEEKALECKTEVTVFYNEKLGEFDYRR